MAATNASKVAAAKNDVIADSKDIVEDVVDLVEDTVELAKTSWLVKVKANPKALIVGALVTGVVIGGVAGYLISAKRSQRKWQKQADEQIEQVKDHYAAVYKTDESLEDLAAKYDAEPSEEVVAERLLSPEEVAERTGPERIAYNKVTPTVEPPVTPFVEQTVTEAIIEATMPVELNVFESTNPDTYFLYSEELVRREQRPDDPFVISQEEFNNNDTEYSQRTMTFYEGDDTLADEQDSPINLNDRDKLVGNENLYRFGHGSGDPNVVYVRNTVLELDMEVVHSDGKFTKEVLGFDDELKHSEHRRPRKFRLSDE